MLRNQTTHWRHGGEAGGAQRPRQHLLCEPAMVRHEEVACDQGGF